MRETLLAVVLIAAGLAGCIGDDGSLDASNAAGMASDAADNASVPILPDGTEAPTSLEGRDCVEQGGTFPVPASAYEDRLPEGFTLATYGEALFGIGEPTRETADLALLAFECQSPEAGTVRAGIAYLLVDPPEVWENPDASFGHGLALALVTESRERAAIYEAWGLGPVVTTGEVDLEATGTPAARTGSLSMQTEGAELRIETAVDGQGQSFPGDLLRVFAADDDGAVTGAMDANWTSIEIALGHAVASGSSDLGAMEGVPVQPGLGFHSWDFAEVDSYVDLPAREAG